MGWLKDWYIPDLKELVSMDEKIKNKAISIWQDQFAKFFPKSKGPTNVEIAMFEAGLREGEELRERYKQALKYIASPSKSEDHFQLRQQDIAKAKAALEEK